MGSGNFKPNIIQVTEKVDCKPENETSAQKRQRSVKETNEYELIDQHARKVCSL